MNMTIVENKYHSTIKVEFRDLVDNIVNSERKSFHLYTIHRLLSLGLLIDFPFEYVKTDEPNKVRLQLDLKEYGKVVFQVDTESSYGSVESEEQIERLSAFAAKYDTNIENMQKRRTLF